MSPFVRADCSPHPPSTRLILSEFLKEQVRGLVPTDRTEVQNFWAGTDSSQNQAFLNFQQILSSLATNLPKLESCFVCGPSISWQARSLALSYADGQPSRHVRWAFSDCVCGWNLGKMAAFFGLRGDPGRLLPAIHYTSCLSSVCHCASNAEIVYCTACQGCGFRAW